MTKKQPATTFAEALTRTVVRAKPRGREPYKLMETYKCLNQTDEWDLFVHICKDKTVSTRSIRRALALMGVQASEMTIGRWRKQMRDGDITASPIQGGI